MEDAERRTQVSNSPHISGCVKLFIVQDVRLARIGKYSGYFESALRSTFVVSYQRISNYNFMNFIV